MRHLQAQNLKKKICHFAFVERCLIVSTMKFAVAFSLVAAASAFNAPNLATRAVKAAPAPKKAAPAPKKAAPVLKKAAPAPVLKKAAPVLKKAAPVLKKAALKKAAPKRFSSGSAVSNCMSLVTIFHGIMLRSLICPVDLSEAIFLSLPRLGLPFLPSFHFSLRSSPISFLSPAYFLCLDYD
jgi:hypothetical protein